MKGLDLCASLSCRPLKISRTYFTLLSDVVCVCVCGSDDRGRGVKERKETCASTTFLIIEVVFNVSELSWEDKCFEMLEFQRQKKKTQSNWSTKTKYARNTYVDGIQIDTFYSNSVQGFKSEVFLLH